MDTVACAWHVEKVFLLPLRHEHGEKHVPRIGTSCWTWHVVDQQLLDVLDVVVAGGECCCHLRFPRLQTIVVVEPLVDDEDLEMIEAAIVLDDFD